MATVVGGHQKAQERLVSQILLVLARMADPAVATFEICSTRGNRRRLGGPWAGGAELEKEISRHALTQGCANADVVARNAAGEIIHLWPLRDVFTAVVARRLSPGALGLTPRSERGIESRGSEISGL